MMRTSPIDFVCPNCNAQPGDPCTQPDGQGRHEVKRFHHSRVTLAVEADLGRAQEEPEPQTAPSPPIDDLARTLIATIKHDPTVTMLACDCGRDLDTHELTVERLRELLEHAAFDHVTRRSVDVYRSAPLVGAWELGVLMRLDAQTEAEETWREYHRQNLT